MDGLVDKKFDLKQRELLRLEESKLLEIQEDFSSRGMLHSGVYIQSVFKVLIDFAIKMIDSLLGAYREVGEATAELIAITKEKEILEEIQKFAESEQSRIKSKIDRMAHVMQMKNATQALSANLAEEARIKAEIFIEIAKRKEKSKQPRKLFTDEVFLIMQIGDAQLDKIWEDVYAQVIQDFKLKPRRIDKHNEGGFLMSEVANLLNKSKIIIADLTNARPNCYLEVGYAYGIEKNSHLILCAREDHNPNSPNYKKDGPKVHFDISGYDILFWDSNKLDEFKIGLAKKIKYRLTVVEK